jgi:uncharacterized damage-inducible protein DinB
MRTADVTTLVDYLYWARDRVLDAAAQLSAEAFVATETVTSRDLRSTLVHELDVEWSWRQRLRATAAEPFDDDAELQPGDYPSVEALREHWQRDESEMRAWLGELSDDDLSGPPRPERAGGPALWVYLVHVVEHGITELSDAAVLLRRAGQPTGSLTFLDYFDTLVPKDPGSA